MAVAEKTSVETTARNPRQQLMLASAMGALYVLTSLWLVYLGLPTLFRLAEVDKITNEFLADSLLLLLTFPVVFGLFVLGRHLEGPQPLHGSRAGAAYLVVAVLVSGLLITCGVPLMSFIGIGLAVVAGIVFFQPAFLPWITKIEEQGWFSTALFKPNQGLRVRRGTVVGLVVVAAFGILTMIRNKVLYTGTLWSVVKPFSDTSSPATHPWVVYLPFSEESLLFMYWITLNVPVLCAVLAVWFSWRLVNWPTFGDFLIATEAEMNKVSWTTRKRLYQDTIVVLVTVVLFTLFLFVVDIIWIKILTNPFIDVLKHDPQQAARKNQSGAQW